MIITYICLFSNLFLTLNLILVVLVWRAWRLSRYGGFGPKIYDCLPCHELKYDLKEISLSVFLHDSNLCPGPAGVAVRWSRGRGGFGPVNLLFSLFYLVVSMFRLISLSGFLYDNINFNLAKLFNDIQCNIQYTDFV